MREKKEEDAQITARGVLHQQNEDATHATVV